MSHEFIGIDQYNVGSRLERMEAAVMRFGVELRDLNSRVAHLEAREMAELNRRTRRLENIDKWFKIVAAAFVGMILGLAITH